MNSVESVAEYVAESVADNEVVKAPDRSTGRDLVSFERAKLSRDDERRPWCLSNHALPSRERVASLRALVQSRVVGRHGSRPTAGETSGLALPPARRAGFQRDLRSRPATGVGAGSSGRPLSVPPEMCVPSCRYWSSPGEPSAGLEPGSRSTPHSSPTAGDRTASRSSRCSDTARFRSPPDRVLCGFQIRR